MRFPEQYRWINAPHGYNSQTGDPFGLFRIPAHVSKGRPLNIIACDGVETGWEHVSVSVMGSNKCPGWDEMCVVKSLFWDDSEAVIQFHPPASDYVNFHPGCLHLWKSVAAPFPLPPTILV